MSAAAVAAPVIDFAVSTVNNAVNDAKNAKQQKRNYQYWQKQQAELEKYQKRAEKRQYDYNKELQDYVYGKNLEQWNRENDYNSPSAQMARYRSAGLNSSLIYGQNNMAASSPQMQIGGVDTAAPSASGVDAAPIPSSYNSMSPALLDAQRVANESALARASVDKMKAETVGALLQNDITTETKDALIRKAFSEVFNMDAETENTKADTEGKKIANGVAEQIAPTKIAQAEQDLKNSQASERLINAQVTNLGLDSRLKSVQIRLAKLDEQIKRVDASNAEELMELRKQRERVAIEFANKQVAYIGKQLASYDAELQAKLAVSAAETFNRQAFGNLAISKDNYQKFVNKINDILLDPTSDVDNGTYLKALILKNLNETSILDIFKVISDYNEDKKKASDEMSGLGDVFDGQSRPQNEEPSEPSPSVHGMPDWFKEKWGIK